MNKLPINCCSRAISDTVLTILLSVVLVGCASSPYIEMELAYAVPFSTDYWQHSDRSWQCEQPQFRGIGGLEWSNGVSLGFYHESMLLCGTWNEKPEIFENGVFIKKKWGGK